MSYDLVGAVGDPEQEQRWRTEAFAQARARRAREVMRRRELVEERPAVVERAA